MVRTIGGVGLMIAVVACRPSAPAQEGAAASGADSLSTLLTQLDRRIVDDPGNASLYAQRSAILTHVDSTKRALADIERAIRLDSTNADYQLSAGDLYYHLVRVDKAQACFQRALDLAPNDTRPKLKLAEIDLVLRKYADAMALVNEALRADPTAAHGYYLKGWIHMETHDTDLAISSYRTAVEQDPKDYEAYIILGKLSAARRDPLAEQYYNTAIELRPHSVEALYDKAIFCQDNGKDSTALACYQRITEIDPKNALAWYNSGYVRLEHLNDPQQAKRDLSKAIDLETNYADAWYNRGVAMERTHQLDSAAANYQICLSIEPTHTLAAMALDHLAKQGVRIKSREKKH